jgi:replication factor C subunit 2/4
MNVIISSDENNNHNDHSKHELKNKIPKNKIPWVDKYRPKVLNDIVQQHEIVSLLKKAIDTQDIPHLLFYGSPGTGKTSTILALCRVLFGPHKANERVIELNASDERGINVVREKIITFAKGYVDQDPNSNYPPYKIIILDEADAMTTEAQSALRKVMETTSKITRFCFICNYIHKIIDPIVSRCAIFRFKPIQYENMFQKLKDISIQENMQISNNIINIVCDYSNGDLRKAIMNLQQIHYITELNSNNEDLIYMHLNFQREKEIETIFTKLLSPKLSIVEVIQIASNLIKDCICLSIFIEQLAHYIKKNKLLSDKQKSLMCIHLSMTEKMLSEGSDETLQLILLVNKMRQIYLS